LGFGLDSQHISLEGDKRAGLWGSRYRRDYVERCSGGRGAATGQTPAPAKNCGSAASVMVEGYMLGRIGGIGEAGMCPLGDRMVFSVRPSCFSRDGGGTLPSLCRQGCRRLNGPSSSHRTDELLEAWVVSAVAKNQASGQSIQARISSRYRPISGIRLHQQARAAMSSTGGCRLPDKCLLPPHVLTIRSSDR
jgi:hypothetical protein